ncbi:MAG: nucleotidyltransferase domain-containing protein [Verrucomicrobiota bacterium]
MRSESDRAATTSQSDQLLREMTEVIVREVHPAQIILFGSRARGEAGPDADVDLLIVRNEPFIPAESRRQQLTRLYELLAGFGVSKDLLLCTRATVEKWRGSINHVIGRAVREGRVLYDRT